MIALIDYGAGNLLSVEKAFLSLGAEVRRVTDPGEASSCAGIVLPGVGNFGDGMKKLQERSFVPFLRDYAKDFKRPLLGICLGMQMLLESSEEAPGVEGLGLFPGKVKRFPEKDSFKIPHMGWNLLVHDGKNPFLKGVPSGSQVYFVHSFYAEPFLGSDSAAKTDYVLNFTSALGRGNVFAVQFHPEKSQKCGLAILENFIHKVRETETIKC